MNTYAIIAENSVGDTRLWLTTTDAAAINAEWERCIAATRAFGGIFVAQADMHNVTFILGIDICHWYTVNSNEYPELYVDLRDYAEA